MKLILFDFQCTEGHQFEDLVKSDVHEVDCPKCGQKAKREISPVRLDWRKMGVDSDFPTCQDKWDKMQREAKNKPDSENLTHY